jgi:hypothetical protein
MPGLLLIPSRPQREIRPLAIQAMILPYTAVKASLSRSSDGTLRLSVACFTEDPALYRKEGEMRGSELRSGSHLPGCQASFMRG